MKEFKSKKPSFYIRTLLKEELYEALEFVIMTNYLHYQKVKPLKEIKYELEQIYKDEIKYFEDTIFYLVLNTENKIIGTIRLRKWSRTNPFLLPGIFSNYNIERENIWHVGRFAISNTADITFKKQVLFKTLIMYAFSHICKNANSSLLADCDERLYIVLRKMGVNLTTIGPSWTCLGSTTLPVYAAYKDIYPFYKKIINQFTYNELHT